MAKFHINPEKGPRPCSAQAGQCPYGADAPHFETQGEAQTHYESDLSRENDPFVPLRKVSKEDRSSRNENFKRKFEAMDYTSVEEFANADRESHEFVDSLIDDRSEESYNRWQQLDNANPYKKDSKNACDVETYKSLKRDYEAFRDKTAELVEAHSESRFYRRLAKPLPNPDRIGRAVRVTGFEPNTREWLEARFDTVGGSDVGTLVNNDFTDPSKMKYYERAALARVEKSKMSMPSDEEISKNQQMSRLGKVGALYRGTVWEGRIQDGYARDHPEIQVYEAKDQFINPDAPWQKINVDGILASKETGEPEGILEIKTGGNPDIWKDGVPLSYRGQTLYYLNVTGLKYADIRVVLNDHQVKDYRLHADSEVAPGSKIKMSDYINTRVSPWFDSLRSNRQYAAA